MNCSKVFTLGLLTFACMGMLPCGDTLATERNVVPKLIDEQVKAYEEFDNYALNLAQGFQINDEVVEDLDKSLEQRYGLEIEDIPLIKMYRELTSFGEKNKIGNCRVLSAACKLKLDELGINNYSFVMAWSNSDDQYTAVMYEKNGKWYVADISKYLGLKGRGDTEATISEELISYLTKSLNVNPITEEVSNISEVLVIEKNLKEDALEKDLDNMDIRVFLRKEYPSALSDFKKLSKERKMGVAFSQKLVKQLNIENKEDISVDSKGRVFDRWGYQIYNIYKY